MEENVVTKDCIVVARRTDSPVAMASQNSVNTTPAGSVVDNTPRDGQQQSKKIKIRVKPSSSTSTKQAVKKPAVASGSAPPPAKGPQPSPSAAAVARQLGSAASTATGPPSMVAESSSLSMRTADGRPPKRHHDQAFPPSQQKKPEYPRRGAPPEIINQPRFEVESIHSDDEDEDEDDASDSDEPLVETQKRRTASQAPHHFSSTQNTTRANPAAAHSVAQAAQIQSLTQQLSESRAACKKATQEKKDAAAEATRLQKQVDGLQKQLKDKEKRYTKWEATVTDLQKKEEASRQAVATRITELERENKLVSEMNVNAKIRYGNLQGRHTQLEGECNQRAFDLNTLQARCTELQDSNRQLQAQVTRLEYRDHIRREMWDQRMAREEKWRSDLIGIINEMNAPRGGGGGARR